MRIIWSSDLPALVLIRGRGVLALAIPDTLPDCEVLELASLVLSASEYEELWRAIGPAADPRLPLDHPGLPLERRSR
jgi:hypothetical protein